MNTRQQRKLNMYLTTEDILESNAEITFGLPKYSTFYGVLKDGIVEIRMQGKQQMFDKSGITVQKNKFKDILVLRTANASRKIHIYAKLENNHLLQSETKFTKSDLKKASDTDLGNNAQGIYDRVQTHLADLALYDLNEESQALLAEAITGFLKFIPKPRISAIDAKQNTSQLNSTYIKVDSALESIDMLMEIVSTSHPEFYKAYKLARRIIISGGGSLSVKGLVTDSINGIGIMGVHLTFTLNGHSKESTDGNGIKKVGGITKKTASKGHFNLKTLPEGIYSVNISKNGYVDQVIILNVTSGELATLNIGMVKNE